MIKGAIGRCQDVPELHVKPSHSNDRMWERLSSCLNLCRFLPPEKEFISHLRPRGATQPCAQSLRFMADCCFFGDTGRAGDLRFMVMSTNTSAVLSRAVFF